jgi:tetratricopeptide (TPR) repeat protein/CHAT domain-containing protein
VLALALGCARAAADEPKYQPLTPGQKAKLQERDRLAAEAQKYNRAGKSNEILAALQKKLAIEREVFGDVNEEVASSLVALAQIHEAREDFDAARKTRKEVLTLRTNLHGDKDWRVTDARLDLEDLELRARLGAAARLRVREAESFNKRARDLWQGGHAREALPLARQALSIRRDLLTENHRDYVTSLMGLAVLYSDLGEYHKALTLFVQARDLRKKLLTENHPAYANSLNNLAVLYQDMGDYRRALPLLEQARDLRKKLLTENHPDYAISLNNLAVLYKDMGNYPRALPLFEQARDLRKKLLTKNHPDYAQALNNLASLYEAMGDYSKALPLYQQARGLIKKLLTENHPHYAIILNNLAGLYQAKGDYREALPLFEQACDLRRKLLTENHPDYASSLNNLAVLYQDMGDYRRALPLLEQARDLRKKLLTKNYLGYAQSLNNLATLYQAMGDYPKALSLFEQACDLHKKLLTEHHPQYADSLNNLAGLYQDMGDYPKALPLLEQARDLRRKLLTENHPGYAQSLNNLAMLYQAMGDYAKALPLLEQARELRQKLLTENHPDYANSLNNLASLYEAMRDYSKAMPLYEQARDLYKKLLTENHPDYATSLDNLAKVYKAMGDDSKALTLFVQARDLRKKLLTENHPAYATSLNNLAVLYQDMGDYPRALPLLEQAHELRRKLLTENHPDYATSLNNLAVLYQDMGDSGKAATLASQALHSQQAFLDRTLAAQSDRQRHDFLLHSSSYLSIYLTCLALRSPAAAPQVYADLLPWKAAGAARRAEELLARDRPDLRPITDQLRQVCAGLARLAQLTPATPDQRDDWLKRFDALEVDKEHLERTLAEKSAAFRRFREVRRAGAAEVAGALPDGTALVDFFYYRPWTAKRKAKQVEFRLLAFVVQRGTDPVCVPLGNTEEIDEALLAWRAAVLRGQNPDADGARLAALVWRPLVKYLGNARTILLAPTGPLALVPFGALPGSKPGTYLLEERTIGYVTSGRHLLELAADTERPTSAGLLALGGLDYGPRPKGSTAVAMRDDPRGLERSPDVNPSLLLRSAYWKPLPGTHFEAEGIARAYRGHFSKGRAALLLAGAEGDAARLRRELTATEDRPRWRYLHLATHGYYQPPAPQPRHAGTDDRFGFDRLRVELTAGRNPLLLSGLVLSGANQSLDQGTLSAEEASVLDLRGVELAILSACDTGLGKVDFDGVQSLQRAFQMAGCRTLVTSLWKVNDAATSVLMEEFYANLWQKQLPKVEALRRAQLTVLNDPERVRRRHAELAKAGLRAPEDEAAPLPRPGAGAGRSHPVLWAAFTLSGDIGKDPVPAK